MRKILTTTILLISSAVIANPQDSTSLDIQDILDKNFNKQVDNVSIDDVNEYQEVGETGGGSEPQEPTNNGKWENLKTYYNVWYVGTSSNIVDVYCDGKHITRTSYGNAESKYKNKVCKTRKIWVSQ